MRMKAIDGFRLSMKANREGGLHTKKNVIDFAWAYRQIFCHASVTSGTNVGVHRSNSSSQNGQLRSSLVTRKSVYKPSSSKFMPCPN